MANCPKCGAHLRLTDWKQKCPHCGVNLILYDRQERLMQEADIAEVQHYHFQKKIDRLKTAFVGSKPAVARIFTSLLPVGALFAPLAAITLKAPLEPYDGSVNLLTIYNAVEHLNFGALASEAPVLFACLLSLAVSVVLVLVHFGLQTLACSPKAMVRGVILNAAQLISAALPVVLLLAAPEKGAGAGRPLVGAYLYVALLLVNAGLDFYVLRHPVAIVHKQCYVGGIPIEEYFEMEKTMTREEIRAEQYKRLQARYDEKQAAAEAAEKEKEAHAHG